MAGIYPLLNLDSAINELNYQSKEVGGIDDSLRWSQDLPTRVHMRKNGTIIQNRRSEMKPRREVPGNQHCVKQKRGLS